MLSGIVCALRIRSSRIACCACWLRKRDCRSTYSPLTSWLVNLELRRFAKLAQRAQCVRIARRGDGDDKGPGVSRLAGYVADLGADEIAVELGGNGDRLVVAIPERARFDLNPHGRVLDDLLISTGLRYGG